MRPRVLIPVVIILLILLALVLWRHSNPPIANFESVVVSAVQSNLVASGPTNDNKNDSAMIPAATTSTPQNLVKVDRNDPE